MARGTTDKRRLIKFSNYSMCVTLPKWVVDQLDWKKGDQLTLVTDIKHGKITLHKETEPPSAQEQETPLEPTDLTPMQELDETTKLRW